MRNTQSILKILFVTTIAIVVITYTYYKTRDMSRGPTITITSPVNGSSVYSSLVKIKGTADNISHLSMNDRKIFTDESGEFTEELLLSSGYNIISIKANDKFERSIEKTLELVYKKEKGFGAELINKSTTTSYTKNSQDPKHTTTPEAIGKKHIGTTTPQIIAE